MVKCPYCETNFHVCDIFPPPEDDDVSVGGEAGVRCSSCFRSFVLAEELMITYSAYPDHEVYEN